MSNFKLTSEFTQQINFLNNENKEIIKQLLQMLHPFQQESDDSVIIGSLDELKSWLITHQQLCRAHIASSSNISPKNSSVIGSFMSTLIFVTLIILKSSTEEIDSENSSFTEHIIFLLLSYALLGGTIGYHVGVYYNGFFAQPRQQEQLKLFDRLYQQLSGITDSYQSIYYTPV